jgi:tetratricopeptide (TPR) repeat protein
LETAIQLATPNYLADFYHHLADVYGRDRRFQDAIDGYQKALEYDSTRTQVLFDIATTYEEFNNNKTIALGYYREYLKRMGDSDNPNVDYALGRIRKIKEDLFMDQ